MELNYVIAQFEINARVISNLMQNVTDGQAVWKPGGKWSLLEIINHLYDEEREDFAWRLKMTFVDPLDEWPDIKPKQWVTERKYNERNLTESINNFLNEREKSIQWLASLKNPNWMNTYNHPELGKISTSKILYNWLAHDYLHIRQITRTLYLYLEENVKPISLNYAGEW